MKKIKSVIRDILPYKLIAERKRNKFWDDAASMKETAELSEECLFDNIISIEGFGATGSSAVIDLVREYRDTVAIGTVDPEGSQTSPKESKCEIDILRYTGGLYQLERCFDESLSQNYFWRDAAVKQLLDVIYFSPFYRDYPALRPYFHTFVKEILSNKVNAAEGSPINHLMGRYYDASDIYYLKHMAVEEYQNLCRKLLNSIFNYFYTGKSDSLILDQLFAACKIETEHFRKYVPNLKQIMVYRDPRDIYCICQRLDLSWMPHDTVEHYIEWVRMAYSNFDKGSSSYTTLRFEDLVLDYDKTVSMLENLLNLSPEQHYRPKACFNPDVSIKSVKEWTREPQYKADFIKIKEALPQLCYED